MAHSAFDHGYHADWTIRVAPGTICRADSGHGIYEYCVLRRHRDPGYWETQITSGGHPALLNSIQVLSESAILAHCYAQ